MRYAPVDIARQFLFLREVGANHGQRIEAVQHWSAGQFGDSYCCEFATMVLDICFQGLSPVPRLQACQDVYDLAKRHGWVTNTPSVGDLFLYVDANDHAHHIGIVSAVTPLTGIAGNTSPDGTSSDGTGVFEHGISARIFVAYPRD